MSKKLLIFAPYYPPHVGGLESHSAEFNYHLAKKGYQITVFTSQLPKNTPLQEIKDNIEIIRFPAFEIVPNYPLPKFWSLKFWKLFISLFKKDFNIVISRTRFFLSSFMALIFAKIKKTPLLHIEHGSDFVQLSSKFKSLIAKIYDYTFGWLIFKFSNKNIAISKAVQKFIYKFDKKRSPIIYRGLNMHDIDNIAKNLKISAKYTDKIIITFVGRLYKWKGVEQSILAIKNLPLVIKEKIVFIIIGDGEDFLNLKKLSSSEPNVKLFGKLQREEAISILKVSSIYIHSAFPGGGLSTSLLEAMYCKNSIIATPNEGANEIIKDNYNGILISDNNPKYISEKLIDLINNPAKIKLFGQNAHSHIKQNFSWKKSIEKYEKEFKELLAKK